MLSGLSKNKKLKRMYHFEECVARRDGYYLSRDVSHAETDSIIEGHITCHDQFYYEGRVTHRDGCMDRYVPHGFWTERQRVCIIR